MDISMLKNQGAGLARGGIWFGAGWVVGKGMVDGDTAVTMVGAVLALVSTGWSTLANTNSAIVQAASQVPEVKSMGFTDKGLAQAARTADPETKVTVMPPPPKETS